MAYNYISRQHLSGNSKFCSDLFVFIIFIIRSYIGTCWLFLHVIVLCESHEEKQRENREKEREREKKDLYLSMSQCPV